MAKISPYQLRVNNIKTEMNRGQGNGKILPYPIALEPPFVKFSHRIEMPRQGFWSLFTGQPVKNQAQFEEVPPLNDLGVVRLVPAKENTFNLAQFRQFILSLKLNYPASFEIIANQEEIVIQLAVRQNDLSLAADIFQSHFPEAEAVEQPDFLKEALNNSQPIITAYGLKDSHFFPLTINPRPDPYAVLLSNLNAITQGMAGVQILFQPVKNNWPENMLTACHDEYDSGKSAFADLSDLPKLVSAKVNSPLFAVSIRLIADSQQLLARAANFISQYSNKDNGFTRLDGDYPANSALARNNHAPGIILNIEELVGLIHLPDSGIHVPKLAKARKTIPLPAIAQSNSGIALGYNSYQGKIRPVTISHEWLTRHLAIFGGTGTGKTNLLGHLFSQLVQNNGCAFIDPNGDAAEEFLSLIPQQALDKVIYFNPARNPLAINPLEIKNRQEAELASVNLLVALRRLFDASAWGPRMEWILRKAIKTLLVSGNKTLSDIPLILTNEPYRKNILASITDPDLLNFWQTVYSKLSIHTLIPILDKLSIFLDSDIIKPIICQPKSDLDFQDIINNRKIFIANLSKGTLGEMNAHILGSFILSGFQMAILSRAAIPKPQRKFFSLTIDEFHSYADTANVDSINSLLSESRKYNVSLITATQFLSQVDRRIKDAIMGNTGTLVCLRVGMDDAQSLQKEFSHFTTEDLLNLKTGEAIARIGTAQDSFNLQIPLLQKPRNDYRQEILRLASQRRRTTNTASSCPSTPVNIPTPPIPPAATLIPADLAMQSQNTLTPEERDFLKFIYQADKLQSSGEISQKMQLHNRDISKLVNNLFQKGLITEARLNLSSKGRKARVPIITQTGIMALGYPSLSGKGGALHQYLQRVIKSYAETQGYQVTIEQPLSQQKSVDLSLIKGAEKTAIEISITTNVSQEMNNIEKNLSAGYDRIIILCTNNQTKDSMEKRVKQRFNTELQAKIFSPAIYNLFQLI